MDYKTKPMGRKDLRAIAKWFRHTFKCRNKFRFDVIKAFEKIPSIFPQVTTEIVEDNSIDIISDIDVPSACIPDMKGNYHIAIRERIYDGACKGIGGYRAHIIHEMCHAVLCLLGFTPILERAFKNNEIEPCYTSMEWQAKALTGEILIPYEDAIGMSKKKIRSLCKVSNNLVEYKLSLEKFEKEDKDLI